MGAVLDLLSRPPRPTLLHQLNDLLVARRALI
jgi:hypothetical protein